VSTSLSGLLGGRALQGRAPRRPGAGLRPALEPKAATQVPARSNLATRPGGPVPWQERHLAFVSLVGRLPASFLAVLVAVCNLFVTNVLIVVSLPLLCDDLGHLSSCRSLSSSPLCHALAHNCPSVRSLAATSSRAMIRALSLARRSRSAMRCSILSSPSRPSA